MNIIPPRSQAATLGPTFTGSVYPLATAPPSDGVSINVINFAPAARTFWHRHEGGQVLVVLAGAGCIQSEGEPVRAIRAGDTVWVPPQERHWHGAGPESYVVHTAVSLGRTEWGTAVTDAEYRGPIEGAEA